MNVAKVLAVAAYPVVMGSSLALSWLLWTDGWSAAPAVGAGVVLAGMFTASLERIIPYQRDWLEGHGDLQVDLCYAGISGPLVSLLSGLLVGTVAGTSARASARLGIEPWPVEWPVACRLGLALIAAEFVGYWLHRLQHKNEFLWRFHAPHHSVHRLYFLNGLRQHPVDSLMTASLNLSVLALMGADPSVMMLYGTYVTAHQLMQHSNVNVALGPLNWVVSMAEVHRWHHSFRRHEMDANYGAALLVWDVIFGTRRFPRDRTLNPRDVAGLADLPGYPAGFLGQLLAPFRSVRPADPSMPRSG